MEYNKYYLPKILKKCDFVFLDRYLLSSVIMSEIETIKTIVFYNFC